MRRLEGKNTARQGQLSLELLKLKSKDYFERRPLHVLGITLLGGIVLHKTKGLQSSMIGFKQFSLLFDLIK
ncbi:hypothetical protein [Vibrio casei]|uniref:Uncharacterized protein n=1 Tax=Vibrio casei TaxID=673372 RepID=A0A368LIR2_9VIBR|nr:hypothetical protein [Vibrio casei]RCS70630.1 hypothetical protein CIK83_14535 [Vibrio casei]HBV77766.1 hypothetical protein [Vibrio sp.]